MGVLDVTTEERVEGKTVPTYKNSISNKKGKKVTYADIVKNGFFDKNTKVSEIGIYNRFFAFLRTWTII